MGGVNSDKRSPGNNAADNPDTANEKAPENIAVQRDYIGGTALVAVTAAVSLVGFLMLLDMSIISTVSCIDPRLTHYPSRGSRTVEHLI